MKHRHNTLLRIVSFLLTVAMLMSTTAFNVLAEEVVDTLKKQLLMRQLYLMEVMLQK